MEMAQCYSARARYVSVVEMRHREMWRFIMPDPGDVFALRPGLIQRQKLCVGRTDPDMVNLLLFALCRRRALKYMMEST